MINKTNKWTEIFQKRMYTIGNILNKKKDIKPRYRSIFITDFILNLASPFPPSIQQSHLQHGSTFPFPPDDARDLFVFIDTFADLFLGQSSLEASTTTSISTKKYNQLKNIHTTWTQGKILLEVELPYE